MYSRTAARASEFALQFGSAETLTFTSLDELGRCPAADAVYIAST